MNVSAAEFKAKCLKMMDNVNDTHEELIVTKHGKPVVKVIPFKGKPKHGIIGFMAGTVTITKEGTYGRTSLLSTGEVWDAEKNAP